MSSRRLGVRGTLTSMTSRRLTWPRCVELNTRKIHFLARLHEPAGILTTLTTVEMTMESDNKDDENAMVAAGVNTATPRPGRPLKATALPVAQSPGFNKETTHPLWDKLKKILHRPQTNTKHTDGSRRVNSNKSKPKSGPNSSST